LNGYYDYEILRFIMVNSVFRAHGIFILIYSRYS
jgi:hypothetical protein